MSFLNGDNLKKIWYPFYPRYNWHRTEGGSITKKALIPIGVNELEIINVKESRSKKDYRKVELVIHKKGGYFRSDDYEMKNEREKGTCSYADIVCLHCPSRYPSGDINKEWYKIFTMSLSNADLDKMFTWKGKKFKALVGHRQRFVEENGKHKVDALGQEILFWEAFILRPYKITDDVEVNDWYQLFKPIRYDPIEEMKGEHTRELYKKNLEKHGFKEKVDEKEVPF